jgi:hypothetical protein
MNDIAGYHQDFYQSLQNSTPALLLKEKGAGIGW